MATFVPINDIRPFNSYTANAGETTFVFDWFVFRPEYVKVYKNDILLEYLTDYSVPNTSVGSSDGGNVILIDPCEAGDEIVISRKSSIKRTSGYTESGEFRASAVNIDLNYLVSLIQEVNLQVERCVILSPSDADTQPLSLQLPKLSDRLGKYLAFDQVGNLIAVPGSSIDLFYSWVRFTENSIIPKQTKKAYADISAEITLKLPIVNSIDDGREISILNLDTNEANIIIDVNSETLTIMGEATDTLEPGAYRSYIYHHGQLKWIRLD